MIILIWEFPNLSTHLDRALHLRRISLVQCRLSSTQWILSEYQRLVTNLVTRFRACQRVVCTRTSTWREQSDLKTFGRVFEECSHVNLVEERKFKITSPKWLFFLAEKRSTLMSFDWRYCLKKNRVRALFAGRNPALDDQKLERANVYIYVN